MLKSEEILNNIKTVKEEMKALMVENKVDDAHSKLTEIDNLKKELEVVKELENEEKKEIKNKIKENKGDVKDMEKEVMVNGLSEEKIEFLNAVRNNQFTNNFSTGSQGAIIPATIATDIIDLVKERLDIIATSTKFNNKGTLSFPVYGVDSTDTGIKAAYAEDFAELTANSGKFTSVDLKEYLVGSLAIIGKSLIANTDVAVYNFVISKVADAIVDFLQSEMTTANSTKIKGYETTTNTVEMGGATVTADDLIHLQMSLKSAFQSNAKWRMPTSIFESLRKLKDTNGRYLLNPDVRTGFGIEILGKPVEINDYATAICYGDFSGYYTNISEQVEIQILLEKYATSHCIGVCAYVEADGKPVDTQRYVKLVAKTTESK